ncbi:hypothetical protein, partial [Pseudomonas aeruginosa]|uniref:hypothetical protein n=1 Tax=Pseudomonas aeruginosa TaxID=287 RepID=UPI00067AF96C
MAVLQTHKVVAQLPAVLEPNAIYFVRRGTGYDQFVTNGAGVVVAYPMNVRIPAAVPGRPQKLSATPDHFGKVLP